MMEIRFQPTVEGSTPSTNDDIYDEVIGRRPNYITRLGYAVVAPSFFRALHVSYDVRLREAKRRHEEEMHQVEKNRRRSQEDIAALQHDNVELRFQLVVCGIKLDELVRRIPSTGSQHPYHGSPYRAEPFGTGHTKPDRYFIDLVRIFF